VSEKLEEENKMQLKSNSSMLSLTKSIDMASTSSTLSIKTNIERTTDGRFVLVKKAGSVDDEYSSEAISSCSDNDVAMAKGDSLASEKCQSSVDIAFDESDDSDSDSMIGHLDVTLVDDADCFCPKNEAERMFYEVVEVLRYEQEVNERLKLLKSLLFISYQFRTNWQPSRFIAISQRIQLKCLSVCLRSGSEITNSCILLSHCNDLSFK